LAELKQGTRPWLKPWSGGDMAASGMTRPLGATGQPYRGINVILLWIEDREQAFRFLKSYAVFNVAQIDGRAVGSVVRNAVAAVRRDDPSQLNCR